MTLRELLTEGSSFLEEQGIENSRLDAFYLLEHVCKITQSEFFLKQNDVVDSENLGAYRELIERRASHEPLQYIIGNTEFMGLFFEVNPSVLIPRQDTECLVEELLPVAEGKKILDMCTGSGCIAVSIAKLGRPHLVAAIDISEAALETAQKNAVYHDVVVQFIHSNLFENCNDKFDLIVSNPPYIETDVIDTLMPEVRVHEPMQALDGMADGLYFYEKIICDAPGYLLPGGQLFFEIGCSQKDAVQQLLKQRGFCNIECKKDFAGLDRIVYATWKADGGKDV